MKNTQVKSIKLYCKGLKGLRCLEALLGRYGRDLIHSVISAHDHGEQVDHYDAIQNLCASQKILFKDREQDLADEKVDLKVAIGWRWLLPSQDSNLIVVHDSLLPRYRGFNPLVSALLNRDKFVGATMLYAAARYDSGPIIFKVKYKVKYPIKIADAIEQMAKLYSELLLTLWKQLQRSGTLPKGKPQTEHLATYSLWRDEADYRVSWQNSAADIEHFIRIVGPPYLGASAIVEGELVRISEAKALPGVRIENKALGKVLYLDEGNPVVVCGKGLLRISAAQFEKSKKSLIPLKKIRCRFS